MGARRRACAAGRERGRSFRALLLGEGEGPAGGVQAFFARVQEGLHGAQGGAPAPASPPLGEGGAGAGEVDHARGGPVCVEQGAQAQRALACLVGH